MSLVDQIIGIESGGNPNARNPNSSATGAGQFIDATWLDMLSRHRPDLVQGRSREDILSLRTDPQLSRAMTEAYSNENSAKLTQAGLPATPGTTYLAHFAGPQGAIKVLQSEPSALVGNVLGQHVVKANPFLANMTVADLQSWADRKMGGKPQAVTPPSGVPEGGPYNVGPGDPYQVAPSMLDPQAPNMQMPFGFPPMTPDPPMSRPPQRPRTQNPYGRPKMAAFLMGKR